MSETTLTKEQIDQLRAETAKECQMKIQEVLQQHNCEIVGVPQISPDGRLTATIQLVSKI